MTRDPFEKVKTSAAIHRDLRNELRSIAGLFGAPEGWSVDVSYGPDYAGQRKAQRYETCGVVYAHHDKHAAHVNVTLHVDGYQTFSVSSRGRVSVAPTRALVSVIAALQSGQGYE